MSKPNHHSLSYKRQAQPNKTYKDLKQKQKAKIAEWMYRETLRFYLTNSRMPDETECEQICRCIFTKIESTSIWVPYEEVKAEYLARQQHLLERIKTAIDNGITLEFFQKPQPVPQSKRVKGQRKPKKKQKSKERHEKSWQDNRFFFIAGYTSGGAPYGVTWEEMGMEPYQSLEDCDEDE